jgi:hypothetical protein
MATTARTSPVSGAVDPAFPTALGER